MPKVLSDPRNCVRCGIVFYRNNGNIRAKYCSRLCACRDRNTIEHQKKAGKSGGEANGKLKYGTGTRGYLKRNGRHEHRIVMEKYLGRKLRRNEIVHHIDENKHNNDIRNLRVMSQSEHARLHFKGRKKNKNV
ncbi:MAG: HNH endonuclease [Patescibacteria group bacterium]|nr:HNH endonuclease [Patescibacteria group bacterium]